MAIDEGKKSLRASLKTEKPVLYIDMDGVLCDFDTRHIELLGRGFSKFKAFDHPDAYVDLDPLPGGIEAFHKLEKIYDVYILSTAAWGNIECWSEKRIWVGKYLGKTANKKLILSHNKGLLRGKYLIDDRIANGVADFEGEHIHFGSEKFPSWKEILEYLLTGEKHKNEETKIADLV